MLTVVYEKNGRIQSPQTDAITCTTGPGCSKLTTSLVNISLKFQTLIFQIRQHFLLKKCENLFALQKLLSFFQQKISVYLDIKL